MSNSITQMKESVRPMFCSLPSRPPEAGTKRLTLSSFCILARGLASVCVAFFSLLVLSSCGSGGDQFTLEGRLLNFNQGEFYVYSTDGLIDDIDTIHVAAGRFSYKTACTEPGTLVIVFPNFSEQPVFAEPGEAVDMKGDAYKLKGLRVTGTDDNKLMNTFRDEVESASPQEEKHAVELFVQNHPSSIVGLYLVRRYFIVCQNPDYKGAARLLAQMLKAQPDNGRLKLLGQQVATMSKMVVGEPLPAFSVTDINGRTFTNKDFAHGDGIIYVWASWEYESCAVQRYIQSLPDGTLKSLGLCIDASLKDCKKILNREDITLPVCCDEQMFESPVVSKLGFNSIPANIVLKNGKIADRNVTQTELRKRFKLHSDS